MINNPPMQTATLPNMDDPSQALDFLNTQLALPPDPAAAALYPNGLALDIALEVAPLAELLEVYELTVEGMQKILRNPAFRTELRQLKESVRQEGFSFKAKARAQAEEYLHTAWKLVHAKETPAAVKADLIKHTVRWAQYEGTQTPGQAMTSPMVTPQMLEDLKSLPDSELEVRVMQILVKRGKGATTDNLPAAIDGEFEEE